MLTVRRIGTLVDIAILAAGGRGHGAVAALTDGREVEMRGATRTELGAEAEAAAATGGRMSEGIEAGAAIEILRGDTGVGAEAGIGIGMIGDRLADTERRCHCLESRLMSYEYCRCLNKYYEAVILRLEPNVNNNTSVGWCIVPLNSHVKAF